MCTCKHMISSLSISSVPTSPGPLHQSPHWKTLQMAVFPQYGKSWNLWQILSCCNWCNYHCLSFPSMFHWLLVSYFLSQWLPMSHTLSKWHPLSQRKEVRGSLDNNNKSIIRKPSLPSATSINVGLVWSLIFDFIFRYHCSYVHLSTRYGQSSSCISSDRRTQVQWHHRCF